MRLRALRWIPIFFFALLSVLAGLLFFLVATEPGARWVVTQIALSMPGNLSIGEIDGRLLGRLTLQQIDYRREQTVLNIDKIVLQWNPTRLLIKEASIEAIEINRLHVVLPSEANTSPAASSQAPVPQIRIPFNIAIEKAVVNGILISGKEETVIDQISFSGRASASEVRIDELKITAPVYDAKLKGRLALKASYPFEATIDWSATLPDARTTKLKGAAEIKGNLNQVHLLHHLTEPVPVETESDIEIIKAKGSPAGVSIHSLGSSTLKGKIDITGEAFWSPSPSWELALVGSSLNPGALRPDLDGVISFEMHTKGRIGEQGISGTFQIKQLTGTMRGHTVTAMGGLDLEGETVRIDRLSLNSGTARLTASGVFSPRWDLAWSLNAPDLSHLFPKAAGRFIGKGRLLGERKLPRGSANIEGSGLVWNDARIDSIKLHFFIDPEDRVESYINLSARGLRKSDQTLDRIELNGKGKRTAHRIQADLKAGKHQLTVQAEGKTDETGWEGKLLRTVMSEEAFGQWNLEKPTPVSIKTDSAEMGEGCWKNAEAAVCVKGRWVKDHGWETSGRAERLPFGLIKPWLPDDISISGAVSGSWEAASRDEKLTSKTRWTLGRGQIEYRGIAPGDGPLREDTMPPAGDTMNPAGDTMNPPKGTITPPGDGFLRGDKITSHEKNIDRLTIGYREGFFQASLEDQTLQAETQLILIGQGNVKASATLSPIGLDENWKQSRLQGSVHAEFSQLGLLTAFAPVLEKTEGKIKLDATVDGTPEKPLLKGTATLDQGTARIPALGIEVKQLRLTASSQKEGTIVVEGTARSGPGSLTINGTVILDAAQGWPTRLVIKGTLFQAADLPEVKLFASPDLVLTVQNRRIDLSGKVVIPEATIKIKEFPKGSSKVSDDVVIMQPGKGEEAPWQINTKVTIQLGDKVKFRGFGLTGEILGQLMVEEGVDRTATGEGELRVVNGRYEAYRQKLEIQTGRLIFTGPVDDPGIDVQAIKKIDRVTVGVRVAGTLKRPEMTLFSDPPMDQNNILSYLLFGTPSSQTQSKGSGVMSEMQSGSSGSFEKASVGVGHYFSPRFYVGYGVSLFDSSNIYRMRYQITNTIALRAESTQLESGIDLLFIKEFK